MRARTARLLGAEVTAWEPRRGGLTRAGAGIVTLEGGGTAFVKFATDDHSAAEMSAELCALREIRASFMPALLGADEGERPLLALEDLSGGHWPEPYPDDLALLEDALAELRSLPVPAGLDPPPIEAARAEWWPELGRRATEGLPPLGAWLAAHENLILATADGIGPGPALVHGDLWYSNVCFLADRVVFVDWSHVRVGSPWHDAATVSVDLVLEGRPPLPSPESAGWAAGYLAASVKRLLEGPHAGIGNPEAWRTDVEELADGAAWWVADELGLPYPPRLSAREVGWR